VVLLPSSLLLLLGLMIPTLRVCGHADAPIQWPPFWGPHVVAALVFAAVLVRPWRLRALEIAIRVILGINAVAWAAMAFPPFCVLAIPLVIPARSSEAMVARCALLAGLASAAWFGVLSADRNALIGAYTSLGASIGLALGGLWWWIEAHLASRRDELERELGGDHRVV